MTTLESFPTHPIISDDESAEFKRLLSVGTAAVPYGHAREFPGPQTLSHVGAAGVWLAERIKATNGHERYVIGLVAQIGRWEFPLQGAEQLFEWWKKERVPEMWDGEVVDPANPLGHAIKRKTITLAAARRLIQFVRDHYPLEVPSEHAPGMTYAQGCDVLEKLLPKNDDPLVPISPKLAHQIQCFAGVAFEQHVGGTEA